jgi:hypothetical protein
VLQSSRRLADIRNGAICCHDFRADLEGGEHFRTAELLQRLLEAQGFSVVRRLDDPRSGVRDVLYVGRD